MSRIDLATFFAVRTPLLPFAVFRDWVSSDGDSGQEWAARRTQAVQTLREAFHRPELAESLRIASPSLHERCRGWLDNPNGEKARKTEIALAKYFARAAYRCTPFGLFAGLSWGVDDGTTSVTLCDSAEYARAARLDFGCLIELSQKLLRDTALGNHLEFVTNPTLWRRADSWVYVEADNDTTRRRFRLTSVEASPPLDAIIARKGPLNKRDLSILVGQSEPTATAQEIDEYIDALVASQVLLTSLEPNMTGADALDIICERLRRASGPSGDSVTQLDHIQNALKRLNESPIGQSCELYGVIDERLSRLLNQPERRHVVQVDLFKPAKSVSLGSSIKAELRRTAEMLFRHARVQEPSELVDFRKRFDERYGDRTVPFLEALDTEFGVGFGLENRYPAPLLDGIPLGGAMISSTNPSPLGLFLLRKYQRAIAAGLPEVDLDDVDEHLHSAQPCPPFPSSFCAIATILCRSGESTNDGYRVLLHGLDGPSGAKWLGRFCYADRALTERVKAYLKSEEALDPDAVYAELVHAPEGRVGNILSRPILREYEIPILGRSGADPQRQIRLDDLLVSTRGGRIRLYSGTLGRRVIPRLTTNHNFYIHNIGLYKFLALLQRQESGMSAFAWPDVLTQTATRLPRVRYGRTILSPTLWYVDHAEADALLARVKSTGTRVFQGWQQQLGLPRFVALVDGDNELPVDFENPLSLECLATELKGRSRSCLREMFDGEECELARSGEGAFHHQFIVPFVVRGGPTRSAIPTTTSAIVPIKHFPGREWFFAKLYVSPGIQDRVLQCGIAPLMERAKAEGLVDRWFFLRYGDPDPHLRVRMRLSGGREENCAVLLRDLNAEVIGRHVRKTVLDTYEPETERYGGQRGLEISEQIFEADSDSVLRIVQELPAQDAGTRWQVALHGLHRFFDDFGLSLDDRILFLRSAGADYARRLGTQPPAKFALDRKYRSVRNSVAQVVSGTAPVLGKAETHLASRSASMGPLVIELTKLERAGDLCRTVGDLLSSYCHMFINRLMPFSANAHEYVLYELLQRHYASGRARQRAATS